MAIRLGVIMDPIERIKPYKDSTFAMLLEAMRRGWQISYIEQQGIYYKDNKVLAMAKSLTVKDDNDDWFALGKATEIALADCNVVLMRKDPPFDMDYIYTTYMLDHVAATGTLVVNHPQSLRDANEKFYTTHFSQWMPPTVVSSQKQPLYDFWRTHEDIILKPLDGMGGQGIFRVTKHEVNFNVIVEELTSLQQRMVMAQKFIPEISEGDKRILLVDGEPVPFALARIPSPGETRGNLAVGGQAKAIPLDDKDKALCEAIGPHLKEKGLIFVGIDLIGNYLTEVNVTSPTCIRELDAAFDLNIAGLLFDAIKAKLS